MKNINVVQEINLNSSDFKIDFDKKNIITVTDKNNLDFKNIVIRKYCGLFYDYCELQFVVKTLFNLNIPKEADISNYIIVVNGHKSDVTRLDTFVSEKYIPKLIESIKNNFSINSIVFNKRMEYFMSLYNSKIFEDAYLNLNMSEPDVMIISYNQYKKLIKNKNNNKDDLISNLIIKSKELNSMIYNFLQL